MRNKIAIVLASALAINGVVMAADSPSPDSTGNKSAVNDTTATPMKFPPGFQQKNLDETKDINHELANLADDACTTSHFDNLVGNLVDQDRDRLNSYKDRDTKQLDGIITQIQGKWKAKYGKEFDPDSSSFQNMVSVITGEVSDVHVAVANFPVNAWTGAAGNIQPAMAAAKEQQADKTFGGDVNLDKGRDVALVRFAAEKGAPELTVSMIHELPDQWRIDIPNNRTGPQVLRDLRTQLSEINKSSAQWPSDENQAYRLYAHHVLMALYGVHGHAHGAAD